MITDHKFEQCSSCTDKPCKICHQLESSHQQSTPTDSARLDWLEKHPEFEILVSSQHWTPRSPNPLSLRGWIDATMEKHESKPTPPPVRRHKIVWQRTLDELSGGINCELMHGSELLGTPFPIPSGWAQAILYTPKEGEL